ncbi:glycogen/starch synthase [Candidatus Woesearchaeota archaeon]|nr:glycogen/starch synthase [Candidatus Woesearchaeota archaeon]
MQTANVFEVSWEVCNKVGGIYTVVKSKAKNMVNRYGENYFLIGPYFPQKALGEFEEKMPSERLKKVFDKLKPEGIVCHYGRWLVEGEPHVILIDFAGFTKNANRIKGEFWEKYGIDSLNTKYYDYDEPLTWAYAAGKVIEAFASKPTVAHFHEWLSGGGLLYLKYVNAEAATVFTTHATMIGRSLASADVDIYSKLKEINADEEARRIGIQAKHLTEKSCAANADVFTTVSEITGIESEAFLGRKPDVILPNGLDIESFPTFEDAAIKHRLLRRKIKDFVMGYFFPYYSFDIEKTFIYFIAGRYEFRDKGIDLYIKALEKLNRMLKEEKSSYTIVAFIWVPANIRGIKPDLLGSKTVFADIQEDLNDEKDEIVSRLIYAMAAKKGVNAEKLLGKSFATEIKKKVMAFRTKGVPPISTHDIYNEEQDSIINAVKSAGLLNRQEDKVKVIFYPIYLTSADKLLNLSYYESMQGSHLGVFPSYYEPWGYTPLEAAALAVASVTTDLAGFGRYVEEMTAKKQKTPGIFVVKRFQRKDEEVVDELAKIMLDFSHFSKEDRIKNKIDAKRLASKADWRIFIENYIDAHNKAIKKRWG